jgi:hypothetical protein
MRERACARDSFGQLISRPVHGVYAARAPDDGNLMPPNRHAAIGSEKRDPIRIAHEEVARAFATRHASMDMRRRGVNCNVVWNTNVRFADHDRFGYYQSEA